MIVYHYKGMHFEIEVDGFNMWTAGFPFTSNCCLTLQKILRAMVDQAKKGGDGDDES